MSVLVYTESENGKLKKNAYEVASYAAAVAKMMSTTVTAVAFNNTENEMLGDFGVSKVIHIKDESLSTFNANTYAASISQVAKSIDAKVIILSSSTDTKYLAPLLSAILSAGYTPNVVEAPDNISPFTVKRTAFSNKGFAHTKIDTDIKIIGVSNNSFGVHENKTDITVEEFTVSLDGISSDTKSVEIDKVVGKATIADADIVVSAGRGLKGPENWGMIEELADVLGAATACSKPVSDLGWRPHGEHVGQTGKPVASNLYIAIGISGAIQHLAGVSASKTKVVINNDPEAPFFKAADYGIVGDAFEVVPQLIEKLKDFKAQNG